MERLSRIIQVGPQCHHECPLEERQRRWDMEEEEAEGD